MNFPMKKKNIPQSTFKMQTLYAHICILQLEIRERRTYFWLLIIKFHTLSFFNGASREGETFHIRPCAWEECKGTRRTGDVILYTTLHIISLSSEIHWENSFTPSSSCENFFPQLKWFFDPLQAFFFLFFRRWKEKSIPPRTSSLLNLERQAQDFFSISNFPLDDRDLKDFI